MSIVDKTLAKFFGTKSERDVKKLQPVLRQVNEIYDKLSSLSHDELRAKTEDLRARILDEVKEEQDEIDKLRKALDEDAYEFEEKAEVYDRIDKLIETIDSKHDDLLNKLVPEAFAVMRETARRFKEKERIEVTATDFDRTLAASHDFVDIEGEKACYHNTWEAGGTEITWDMVHYDVQIIGGVFLHQGRIAEMATGEGKTLVATLPVFLNALTAKGVHLVTVNDYLARRDAEWMGPLFQFHGLSVDCIDKHQPNSSERRKAYQADVTYGTNNEFGFDYLRDNMALAPEELVQRKHHYAIVDEVDSVLIDDARTPLIISGPVPQSTDDQQLFKTYKPQVLALFQKQHQLVTKLLNEAKSLIKKGDREKGGFKLLQAHKGVPKNKALIKFLSEEGMKQLMQKTEGVYLEQNAKRMPEVTQDLYFVIDEKSNAVEITDKGHEELTKVIDDPEFFIIPDIGTKITEIDEGQLSEDKKVKKKDELLNEFSVKSERVHAVNQLLKAYTMFEKDVEYVVMDGKVKIVDEQTGRIMEGRRYSEGLHQAIEAKEDVKVEAATQTFATITLQNYFRMYHKLSGMTGTAETEAGEFMNIYELDVAVTPTNKPIIRDDRNDKIYKTKKEKYEQVINEIDDLVKQGRALLVGTTSVEVSEVLSRLLTRRKMDHNVLNAKQHAREADIVAEAGQPGKITIATNMAGRGTDIKLAQEVKESGGLAIIGTERHESRRIDRQLRGRAGRQGDPGSSQFFVSLEDDLMRLFGSDRISKLMDRMGLEDGDVIQHPMISKSIERAQRKVEENNFGIRKRLLEYDDVMNSQREVIYTKRRHALYGERIDVDIVNMIYDLVQNTVEENHGEVDFDEFQMTLLRNVSINSPINEEEYKSLSTQAIIERVYPAVLDSYKRRVNAIAETAMPFIKDVYEHQKEVYKNVVIPISDGSKVFRVIVNLERAYKTEGREVMRSYQKTVMLMTIDESWKEHLREMDDLKQSVQNATYEQKDPLLIYKLESYDLFQGMMLRINRDAITTLVKGQIYLESPDQVEQAEQRKRQDYSRYDARKDEFGSGNKGQKQQSKKAQPVRRGKKIGRNDPCPCGSGKKYKSCHGKPGAPELDIDQIKQQNS